MMKVLTAIAPFKFKLRNGITHIAFSSVEYLLYGSAVSNANRSSIRSCNSGCRLTNRLNARLNDDARTTVFTCLTHPLFE